MVPRTPDGKPDLQGVWANNSVTPMTRPTQWKDKERLTDAELTELKAIVQKFTDQGGDAIFQSVIQLALDAKEKGKFDQTSYDPTTGNYNQFWMAERDWDNRTALIIDPPERPVPAVYARGNETRRSLGGSSRRRPRADRPATPTAPRIGLSTSAASPTVRRWRSPGTTPTSRSSSRRKRS